MIRWTILDILFWIEDQDFAKVSVKKFYDHVNGSAVLPLMLRTIIYRTALSVDGKRAFDELLKVI